jgi:hypothetical protein
MPFLKLIEGFWCTDCNAENLSCLQSTVYEKIKKSWPKWSKITVFAGFSCFFRKATLQRAEVYALHSVHQNRSFELSKSRIQQFLPQGGTLLIWGVNILPTQEVEGLERKEGQF